MNTNDRQLDKTDKKIMTALFSIISNYLYNDYALENIILSKIIPGSLIPYDLYLKELQLKQYESFLNRKAIEGATIDDKEKIRNKPLQEYLEQYYIRQVNSIFKMAPKHKHSEDISTILPFKYGLKKYLEELYYLYKQILAISITPEFFELISPLDNYAALVKNNRLSQKFIATIKIKKLRKGSRIDKYVKNIPYPSDFLKKLYRKEKGHYILINNDANSIDYKFALFSCFFFHTAENQKLLELKIKKWENKYYINKINQ